MSQPRLLFPAELKNHANVTEILTREAGGKARNLYRMTEKGFPVPAWFCVSASSFQEFVQHNGLRAELSRIEQMPPEHFEAQAKHIEEIFLKGTLSVELEREIQKALQQLDLEHCFVAVRSSGLDEDSAANSFAGQFSSFLFQKGATAIAESLKRCWASGFSARAMAYRVERGIPLSGIAVGVVIQKMVNADCAGVAFSRNPVRALDRDSMLIASVYGLGEGLVSGYLESDNYDVSRSELAAGRLKVASALVLKDQAFRQSPAGGVSIVGVSEAVQLISSLTPADIEAIARLTERLEVELGAPQDCEWAIENGALFVVQTRPITSLPSEAFYDLSIRGRGPTLWDNSNIIESYSGVTSPLTFSFASRVYRQVYIQFCEIMGVPQDWIDAREEVFRNMLGLIRGRIYYNLVNWYKLVLLLPGSSSNKSFMETMMGVKQGLKPEVAPEVAKLFEFVQNPPRYRWHQKLKLTLQTVVRFQQIDALIANFNQSFVAAYDVAREKDYRQIGFDELVAEYHKLEDQFLKKWQVPIINDYLCMIFFGLLKSMTEKWIAAGDAGGSMQNDLLCGQGDLESTEPTKTLMRIAAHIDSQQGPFRDWFLAEKPAVVWSELKSRNEQVYQQFAVFLDRFGFRCINELKLEENDLHDDPSFIVNSVQSYVRTGSYEIAKMEAREREIRAKAEAQLSQRLSGVKYHAYQWILKQTRRAVKNRENLRFARTKVFGVTRNLIRGMGAQLLRMGLLKNERDVFYLTIEELIAFSEGRGVTLNLGELAELRKREFKNFDKTLPSPDRFILKGAVGASLPYAQVLCELDLLKDERPKSDDPNVLIGTPCCPGIVEGVVRVVRDMRDAEGINGEILVTERTDPGWVPLYPSCSGLLIERGSLLSHSAVVARELGLPTIVGISGGLMRKLKTGDRVRIDGGKGEMRKL